MPNINIIVREKIAQAVGDTHIVCGNSDYTAVFDFDAEWDAYETKTARFIWNGKYTDVVFTGTKCPVPVITGAFGVLVGVYAGDLHTTTAATVDTEISILCRNGLPADPPPDVYAQIIAKLNGMASPEWKDIQDKPFTALGDGLSVDKDNKLSVSGKIDAPQTATVGEVLTVEEVDEDGKPIKWKTQVVETAPPDWDENGSTKPGYVKNRPGGFFTKQERIVTLKEQWDSAHAMIPATDPQSTVLSIDGENRTIEFTYNKEYGGYFYADEGTGIEFHLTPANSKYSYIYFETVEDGTHTVRLTELIPHEFYDVLMPSSVKRNLEFIPGSSGEFTEEEKNAFSEIIGTVTVTKKYDNLPKYHPLLSTTDGMLFIGGKFIEEENKLITINSLSSETQTFEDFVDTYGFIRLNVLDINGYNTYIVPMYIADPYGITSVDEKNYYTCAQATAYINGHLFAFHAYQYAYRGNKLHSTLTVKRIL